MTKIRLHNVDEVWVQVDAELGIIYEMSDYFTFQVPGAKFMPSYRNRLWDGTIKLLSVRTQRIYRGLVPEIAKFCESRGYEWFYDNEDYDDEFSVEEAREWISTIGLPEKYEVRDYQMDAFVHSVRTRRALLLSPTASGKSLIIYLLMRYYHEKQPEGRILLVVPTTSLVSQLAGDFADYGFDSDSEVYQIMGGREKSTDSRIVISTWQSIYKLPKPYFDSFTTVIGDEAHLFKANSLKDILEKCVAASKRFGFTGTLDGTQTHRLVLEGLFGTVRSVTSTKELMDQQHLADFRIKAILLKHPEENCKAARDFKYQEELEYLVLNNHRNRFIRNLALSLDGNTLILYQYVDKHGKTLYDMIRDKADKNREVNFIYGNTSVDDREKIRKRIESQTDSITVASFGTYSTGINIVNLHNIIFASPSKSRIRNLQSIGRGLRKGENKTAATLFDIADDLRYKSKENYTLKHFAKRIQIYTEEQFRFRIYKVQLKG